MLKKRLIIFLGAFLLLSVSGCGSDDENKSSPDVHTLAQQLIEVVTFEDYVDEISREQAQKYYGINSSQINDCVVYMSTGATAEEMAIFEAASESEAVALHGVMTDRKETQIKNYIDKSQKEISRLDSCVLYRQGSFVVYVVSDNTAEVRKVIKRYLE